MKKSLALVIGITLVGASIIPFSEASRDAYHNYLYKTGENENRFAEGRTRINTVKRYGSQTQQGVNYYRNYRGSRDAFERSNAIRRDDQVTRSNRPLRPSTFRWAPKSGQPLSRGSLLVRNVQNQNIPFYTYENEEFSLQIPKGWTNSSEDTHTFTNENGDYTVSIKKFSNKACSTSENFTGCAVKLSKSENNLAVPGDGKLVITSRIVRQAYNTDTILDTPGVYTKVYTESFTANGLSASEKYINRYYAQDTDGEVFLIETETTPKLSGKYLSISNTIFDSFRIYAEDTE